MKKSLIALVILSAVILVFTAGCEKDANYYLNAGNAKYMSKQFKEAITDLDKAIEMNPKLADAYMKRGRCYQQLKKYDQAIADYKKVIDLESDTKMAKRAKQLIEEINSMK